MMMMMMMMVVMMMIGIRLRLARLARRKHPADSTSYITHSITKFHRVDLGQNRRNPKGIAI